MNKIMVITLLCGVFLSSAQATVLPTTIRSDVADRAPRWMFGEKKKKSTSGIEKQMERVKKDQLAGNYSRCAQRAKSAQASSKNMAPWLILVELNCSRQAFELKSVKSNFLYSVVRRVESRTSWLAYGPQKNQLRKELVHSRLSLLQKDVRRNRQRAWKAVDRLLQMEEWLTVGQKAEVYKLAGDLAFIEQKMKAARGFVLQSLSFEGSEDLQRKLTAIEKALSRKEAVNAELDSPSVPGRPVADEATKEEARLEEQINTSMERGDLVSVAQDALKIINNFPGGRRALWAQKRVLDSYLKVRRAGEGKVFSAKKKIIQEMKKADGLRLQTWSRTLYRRGFYADALQLAEESVKKLQGSNLQKVSLKVAAYSAMYIDDWKKAEGLFLKLIKKNSGSQEAIDGTMRLGLVYYRQGQFSKATTFFEKLLYLPGAQNYELTARYWLWRSFQKVQEGRAEQERQQLISKFPLTYYGLRARAEGQGEMLELPPKTENSKMKEKIWLTSGQRQGWARFKTLLNAGWFEEAQVELSLLPPGQNETENLILSRYWAAAFDYRKAIRLARKSTPMQARLNTNRFIKYSYPQELSTLVKKEAKRNNISENLIRSLIRQESSFFPTAVSHANAIGLMQLIPSTAEEVAGKVGMKDFSPLRDLMIPEKNMQLGSKYLADLLKRFGGNVPLALAAYNAGPTRVARWISKREGLKDLPKKKSSSPDIEIWIDELPWKETNFYVKSVMRNYIVYKILDQRQVELNNPIWE